MLNNNKLRSIKKIQPIINKDIQLQTLQKKTKQQPAQTVQPTRSNQQNSQVDDTTSIKSSGSNGINSICSHKDRVYDTFDFRFDFIRNLLNGAVIKPMINLDNIDNLETETFVNPNNYKNNSNNTDIQVILNKQKHDIHNFIKNIGGSGGKLKYIKSGSTGHTFKGISNADDGTIINYGFKVVAYPKKDKYGTIHNVKRPENAELMMIRLLSYFVINKQTPHIVLPIGTFNTGIETFVNLLDTDLIQDNKKKYEEFVDNYKKGEYHDTVSILISEWANMGDLLDFIRRSYLEFKLIDWKVLFFQIISVIAVIQSKYPSFRHNDMKANNILVHKIQKRGTVFSYMVKNNKYFVPNIGYMIKLWDFDFACIPNVVDNSKVNAKWTNDINIKPIMNRYYDMHYFFNTLIKKGFFPQLMTDASIDKEIKDFINRIVPPKYQTGPDVTKRGRILINDEYLTPHDVLSKDPFFKCFRSDMIDLKELRNLCSK